MTSLKDFDYEDIKVIGRGQYGKAHLVKSGQDQGQYIAKTIDLTCLSKRERDTALQEVALLRRLDHPNIVQYKDNFFMGDTLVIIMQYCEGGDLATLIKDYAKAKNPKKRIREELIMSYFVQVLHALQYIHGQRILHRDLKTSNLFLMDMKRTVKLGDFGISRVLEGSIEAAITVVGTPYYMSPEVCENKPYTFKSDVWALGCVLYELCMLKHAFSADNLLGLVYKIVSDKYDPIPKFYSAQLNNLIHQMLEKDAEKRPSVGDLLADPYTQRMEYNEVRGQCANSHGQPAGPSSSSTGPRAGHRGSGGSSSSKGSGSSAVPRSGGTPTPGSKQGSSGSSHDPAAAAEDGSDSRGAARGRTARQVGARPAETPKEAAERRKREAADRKAAELKQAAAQATQNKSVARQMKEAQFGQTRMGGAAMSSTRSPQSSGSTATTAANTPKHDEGCRPGGLAEHLEAEEDDDDDYSGSDASSLETEEISEEEEYESDFEDEVHTEDEDEAYHGRPPPPHGMPHSALSTVREEQEAFARTGEHSAQLFSQASPGGRRPSGNIACSASLVRAGAEQVRTGSPTTNPSPQLRPAGTIIPMQERQSRLREECEKKVGKDVFQKAFDFLLDARQKGVDEKSVKRGLENIMGRENYRNHGLSIDQLVVQRLM